MVDPPLRLASTVHVGAFKWTGNFTAIDLIAAATNSLNGALLARWPDHYKNWTIVGILLMALLMGIGGRMTRDVLVNQVPGALTNPPTSPSRSHSGSSAICSRTRTGSSSVGLLQFVTSFSLPWYAIAGAQKGVAVGLPVLRCLALATIGPTASRWCVDVSSGFPPGTSSAVNGLWQSRSSPALSG